MYEYDTSDAGTRQFLNSFNWLYDAYMNQCIIFESLQAKQDFEKIVF